jgi:hypothetical protein
VNRPSTADIVLFRPRAALWPRPIRRVVMDGVELRGVRSVTVREMVGEPPRGEHHLFRFGSV